ncbi:MAG: dockerin type I repeat-containing protein, partial [Bacteroidaceae bacterium]|nr:dockerin type I repeat-containing protein [Bacteroidaceae bacterium]
LAKFDIVPTDNGDFEITTEVTRHYIDGEWVEFDEPLKVWVGYDMRGNLKIFPQDVKEGLEKEDYTLGFGLPVDFGFDIYAADVNKELVPDLTIGQMCNEVIGKTLKIAEEKWALYEEYMEDYDWYYAADTYAEAMAAAEEALATEDLANVFEANKTVEAAIAQVVAVKANYYSELIDELEAEVNANYAGYPYKKEDEGKYTSASKELLESAMNQVTNIIDNSETLSYTAIENALAEIQASLDQLEGTKLTLSTLPQVVKDIPANVFHSEYINNAVWTQNITLNEGVRGVRLTFLENHPGNSGNIRNYPMIAIGEINVYDVDGNKIPLDSTCFEANYTETQEGFASTVARLCDGNYGAQGFYHSPWSGEEPQEYIWIDIDFPGTEAHQVFTLEVFSRDRSTTMGRVSLFPKKVAITEVGSPYKPLLYVENPYNVTVGNKITSVDQIKADGLYVIMGLHNTQSVLEFNEDSMIVDTEPTGTAMFYHGFDRFHASAQAVRAEGVYRFVPNGDGTFKALNLGLAKYLPSTEESGFISGKTTYEAEKAANLNIVSSTNVNGAFVMYEFHEGLTTTTFDANGESAIYQTPYVTYMDWDGGMASRPVTDPQPFRDPDGNIRDAQGDVLCFNKANGEGEWEIYEVTMDNPDFYWLTNMTSVIENLGLVRGTDPGCVSDLGVLGTVLENAEQVVADSAYADAPAAAVALAKEIAAVDSLEKNPMEPGVYQIVSANADFMAKQGVEKALYATIDANGVPFFGWKTLEEGNTGFYFKFEQVDGRDYVDSGRIEEEQADLVYSIRPIAKYDADHNPYYIGQARGTSTQIGLVSIYPSHYLVKNLEGAEFNLRLASGEPDFCIHTNGHGGGSGQSGDIVYWDGTIGSSQWFLRRVDAEEIESTEGTIARNGLFEAIEKLRTLLNGVEGNSTITEANRLLQSAEAGIDSFTITELLQMTDRLNEAYDNINGSTTIFIAEVPCYSTANKNSVAFEMNNAISNLSAFQCNIHLPAGFSIALKEDGTYDVELNRNRVSSTHTISASKKDDGSYLLVCYSNNNEVIKDGSGELFYINIETDRLALAGTHTIQASNILFSTPAGKEIAVADNTLGSIEMYMPADVETDNILNSEDLRRVVTALSQDDYNWERLEKAAADMNEDGEITIIDIAAVSDAVNNGYVKREMNTMQDDGSITFRIENNGFHSNAENQFPVSIESDKPVTAVQFDMSIAGGAGFGGATLNGNAINTHLLNVTELSNGNWRIIIYASNNAAINNDLLTITINGPRKENQEQSIDITNLKICTSDFNEYWFADINISVSTSKMGDANGDGKITISDVVMTVNALMNNINDNFVLEAADMNKDGKITIADVVGVVNALLNGEEEETPSIGDINIGDDVDNAVTNAPIKHGLPALHVSNASANEATMIVRLDNAHMYSAMQFDMALPEGVSIKEISMNGKHHIAYNERRVVAYSLTNSTFGEDGNIMSITLDVDNSIEGAVIAFDNIIVSTPESAERRLNAVNARVEGTTGIDGAECDATVIYAEEGRIVIEATNNGVAEIINAYGIVHKVEIATGKNHIAVEQKGVFVVKIGNKITKVVL